jgi:hypothetical protein
MFVILDCMNLPAKYSHPWLHILLLVCVTQLVSLIVASYTYELITISIHELMLLAVIVTLREAHILDLF